MDNNKEKDKQEKPAASGKEAVAQGEEAIKVQQKVSGKPAEEAEKENKDDAAKWHQEG